jgi:solute carrier family 25 (mitochondrial carnitine/acylcarnitine transporter), member 20/29
MSATSASGSSLTSLSRRRSRCQMSRAETSQTSVFTPFTWHLPESLTRAQSSSRPNDGLSWTSVRNSLVAGYAAGVCGTLIGHPLDSIKVWIQTKSSLQRHSLQCLYRGVSVPLVTVGFIQCINFGIYDASLRLLLSDQQPPPGYSAADASPLSHVIAASILAGCGLATITSPLLICKTQQQTRPVSMRQACHDVLHGMGTSSAPRYSAFFTGFRLHFVTEVVSRAIYYGCYETFKRQLVSQSTRRHHHPATVGERMMAASLAGIITWTVIYPLDVWRSRKFAVAHLPTAALDTTWKPSRSIPDSFLQLASSIRSLYRGFGVVVLRAGPVAATVLPIYDCTLQWLSTPTPVSVC